MTNVFGFEFPAGIVGDYAKEIKQRIIQQMNPADLFVDSCFLREITPELKKFLQQPRRNSYLLYKLKNKTSRGNLFNLIANLNIGRIEIVNGNFDLALKALDAISLDKENATVASLKGDALRGLGRLELAEAQYTKAIDLSQIAEERAVAEYKLKLISQ